MGHSGRTSGATGAPGEMAFTEAVGAACRSLLDGRGGWSVRTIAADVSSSAYRGDAFVAVHADGSTNPSVRGASLGYQNAAGAALAQRWRHAYAARGFTGPWNGDNYTVNLAQYYGVRIALGVGTARAFIAECGTITNAADRALMTPERVALSIGDAVGVPQPQTTDPVPEDDLMITFITCLSPNQSGTLLPDGRMQDITDDSEARKSAQALINAGRVVEWRVSEGTFQALLDGAPSNG